MHMIQHDSYFNPTADCGAPPHPVNGSFLQPHTNTTVGSVVVFQCDPGFVPEGEMTAVCGSDGQWVPNPGDVTCSPRPTQILTKTPTPTQTSTPTSKSYTLHFILYLNNSRTVQGEHREHPWEELWTCMIGWWFAATASQIFHSGMQLLCIVHMQSFSLVEISLKAFFFLITILVHLKWLRSNS